MTDETTETEASSELGGRIDAFVMPDYYPEHNTKSGGECWCEPEVVKVEGSSIFIHREIH